MVSYNTVCNEGPASSWWSHAKNKKYIDNSSERHVFFVIVSVMIVPSSDDLNWWMSSKEFFFRHVEIIDKEYHFLLSFWTLYSEFFPCQLVVNVILN